jgi:ribonuclease Z
MKLIFLGTGAFHPTQRRHTACLMLPELGVVLDAGTAMFRVRDRLVTPTIDIYITHPHLDHIFGLSGLLDIVYEKSIERVRVHTTENVITAIQEHLFNKALFPVDPISEFIPLADSEPLPEGGVLTHFPVVHPGGAVGFRLDWPDRSLAYVTDTTSTTKSAYLERVRGVDVLIHECNFSDEHVDLAKLTGHSHTTAVAEFAQAAGVGRLLLVHTNPLSIADDPIGIAAARKIFPATELAEDLMEIEF